MFTEAIAISLVASGLAETLSLSGKKVYEKVQDVLSQSDQEALTEEFVSNLAASLSDNEEDFDRAEVEELVEQVNETVIGSVYLNRQEIAKSIAVQLSTSGYDFELTTDEATKVVEQALDEAVGNWFNSIKGTDTADLFLLEATWETQSRVAKLQEELDAAVENQNRTKWYSRIDIESSQEASEKVSHRLDSSRPTTRNIYVDRPEIPDELSHDKYLISGRRGMGKTRSLDRLQSRFISEREIDHVIIPNDGFLGQEDARDFAEETFEGDVLLVWDDIHGLRAGQQSATVREAIIRISDILSEAGDSLHVLASVRSEYLDEIDHLNRPKDRVWKNFQQIQLEPLDEETVRSLTNQIIDAEGLDLDRRLRAKVAFEVWYSDPSPLYVESVISSLKDSDDPHAELENLPIDVSGVWESQYERLKTEHPETRFILRSINLLRMGAIPIYEPALRSIYAEVFNRDRFEFDRQIEVLLEKQWVWKTDNPGPDIDETVYDIRAAQVSGVEEDRIEVIEDFSEFLLNSLSDVIPEEVSDWIPGYHSNFAMFLFGNLAGDTRSLAERHLERADALAPFHPAVQNNYAAFLQLEGRPEEALEHYERILALSPEWAEIRHAYATILDDELGRPYEAIENYQKAIASEQPQPQAHRNLGALYSDLGQYQMAKREFEKALSKGLHIEAVYINLGALYWATGEHLQAKEVLEDGIELFPRSSKMRYNLAAVLWELEYPKRALEVLEPLLDSDSEQGSARLHGRLSMIFADLGERDKVMKHWELAQSADTGETPLKVDSFDEIVIEDITQQDDWKDKPALLRAIDAVHCQGNYTKAWEKGQELLEQGYESAGFYRRLADIAEKLDKINEAEEYYQKALSLNPSDGKTWHHFGNFLKHCGRVDDAEDKFLEAIELSDNPAVYNDFGLLHFQSGSHGGAARQFERGIQICEDRENPTLERKKLHYNYGQLLYYCGANSEAKSHYEVAIELDGDYANAQFGLAQVKAEEGDIDGALNLFKGALAGHANEGNLEEWRAALFEALNTLDDNGWYNEAIEQCEYGLRMANSLGLHGQPLTTTLRNRKELYESKIEDAE